MAAETGQRVGDYEVLAQLGIGGMGRVYKVRNVISNREEAMKILLPDFASDPELAARFMSEIRTLATLDHPGIAQLRTAFQFQNQFVMVMEFVEGITLEKLAAQVRIPLDHALDYAGQVLAALSYAHSRGVIHRDIKPANIMITTHGVVKLMDFGIAKSKEDMQLTRPGTTMGSVYYMSPEQVRGDTVDARSDLYSLGVTLYEVFTGRKPFQAETSYSILDAQLNKAPTPPVDVNPDLPPELNAIVLRAMEKRPEDRFQTADEFRSALKSMGKGTAASAVSGVQAAPVPVSGASWQQEQVVSAASSPQTAPPFTPVPPVPVPTPVAARGHRGLWIGLGAGLALLALVAVALVLPHIFATHASQKAPSAAAAAAAADNASLTPAAAAVAPPGNAPAQTQGAVTSQSSQSTPAAASPAQSGIHSTAPSARAAVPRTNMAAKPSSAPLQAATPIAGGNQAQTSPAGPATPSGPSAKDVNDARDRCSGIEARADAALSTLQQMRSQQQAQGLDMRGDIVAGMSRLQSDLKSAQRGIDQKDLASANEYMDRADHELAALEKFLGR